MNKSKNLKLLTKITLIASLLLLLGGCNVFERQEYEKRISRVSEVYPTEKVSDLFDKFPGGFSIYHEREEKITNNEGHETYKSHKVMLYGNPDNKSITGTYEQEIGSDINLTIDIAYDDIQGLTTIESYQFEPIMQNFHFLFQKLNLNKNELKRMEFLNVTSNPVSNSYSIRYKIKNQELNRYLNLPDKETLKIKFYGSKNKQNHNYQTSFWINQGLKNSYLSETVTGFE